MDREKKIGILYITGIMYIKGWDGEGGGGRQTDKQINRQRETDRQTDRQTDREREILFNARGDNIC